MLKFAQRLFRLKQNVTLHPQWFTRRAHWLFATAAPRASISSATSSFLLCASSLAAAGVLTILRAISEVRWKKRSKLYVRTATLELNSLEKLHVELGVRWSLFKHPQFVVEGNVENDKHYEYHKHEPCHAFVLAAGVTPCGKSGTAPVDSVDGVVDLQWQRRCNILTCCYRHVFDRRHILPTGFKPNTFQTRLWYNNRSDSTITSTYTSRFRLYMST